MKRLIFTVRLIIFLDVLNHLPVSSIFILHLLHSKKKKRHFLKIIFKIVVWLNPFNLLLIHQLNMAHILFSVRSILGSLVIVLPEQLSVLLLEHLNLLEYQQLLLYKLCRFVRFHLLKVNNFLTKALLHSRQIIEKYGNIRRKLFVFVYI